MYVPNPIPTLRPTHLYLWSLCAIYSGKFPDLKQPVRSELIAAFIPRVIRFLTLRLYAAEILRGIDYIFRDGIAASDEVRSMAVNSAGDELLQCSEDLVSEIVELDSWPHDSGLDVNGCGNWLTDRGYSFQEASELIEKSKKCQAGRRPSKRKITVAALETRRLDGRRSWSSLANEFCDCGKPRHDAFCRETLRKSAGKLESVLKKYRDIPVPADLLAPLSNILHESLRNPVDHCDPEKAKLLFSTLRLSMLSSTLHCIGKEGA